MADEPTDDVLEIDLVETLGVSGVTSAEMLTLYIPNKDKHGREFGTQRKWVLRAAELLAYIGGGVTIMPLVEGGWLNRRRQIDASSAAIAFFESEEGRAIAIMPRRRGPTPSTHST